MQVLAPIVIGALVVSLALVGFLGYSLGSGPDYQNDDYVPPPPGPAAPLPSGSADDAYARVTANDLYAQSIPEPVRCEQPDPDFDVLSATDEEVATYINDLMTCAMRVWNPAFEATRWELTRPEVTVYRESITTPCGSGRPDGPNARYCITDQGVYFSRNVAEWQRPHIIDEVMAHEFGHHVQARAGILGAERYLRESSRGGGMSRELSRRSELQADCFEGMFMRSIQLSRGYTDSQIAEIKQSVYASGDETRRRRGGGPARGGHHGTGDSRVYWWNQGFTGTDIGRCNTYTAPSELVR